MPPLPGDIDHETFEAYEHNAQHFADEWHAQPEPSDLYATLREYFVPGPTADIGCGAGRDSAWLSRHGFECVGFDASPALVEQARRGHPHIAFGVNRLPELAGIDVQQFQNVLCETVIMHLGRTLIPAAVRRLVTLLQPAGTLYLSWRVTTGSDRRDEAGRFYAAFPASLVTEALEGAKLIFETEAQSHSSKRLIHRIVARAPSDDDRERPATDV